MKHQLTLNNNIEEIPRLAMFVDMICEEANAPMSMSMSLNLALEEAVTNVMLYAYPAETKGKVKIVCRKRKQGDLSFSIIDSGMPFDPTLVKEADITLGVEERPIGGLGIFLVKEIMDQVSYKHVNGKNMLTLVKSLQETENL